jgi:predicted NACHT family NTPase
VETLLNSWNLARSLDRYRGAHPLTTHDVLKVLAPLALWMQENSPGQGLVKQQATLRQLAEIYRQRQVTDPEQAAQVLLAHAREYASLLLERGAGQYGFIHLTFLEYLAAVGLAQLGQQNIDPVVEQLAQHVMESAWHEVTLLTVGYMGIVQGREEAAGDVVVKLLQSGAGAPRAWGLPAARWWLMRCYAP